MIRFKLFTKTLSLLMKMSLVAVFVILANPARSEIREYFGGGVISNFSRCENYGWPTSNQMFRVRYRPRELTGQANELIFNLAVGGVAALRFSGTLSAATSWRRVAGRAIWGGVYYLRERPRIRVLRMMDVHEMAPWSPEGARHSPSPVPGYVMMRIRHFNGLRGCTVTAAFTLTALDE